MAVKTYSLKKDGATKLSPHFRVREFTCPDSDTVKIDPKLIAILERLYDYLGCSKIIITSGYRTPAYDRKVGGSGRGYHTEGRAADVNCWRGDSRIHGSEICCALQELGWHHGIGWIAGHAVHVDTRTARYWFDEQNGNRSIGGDWYAYMEEKGHHVPRLAKGDVDGDGKVTSTDARLALQAAVGKVTLTEKQAIAADQNGDGTVDSTDARQILQRAVKK
ncbi:MAG: hypothetical protein E7549_00390 [Ruminococcaceae bacterium]|nr:hypothetical protein [Oscillospiraceae bacterium]